MTLSYADVNHKQIDAMLEANGICTISLPCKRMRLSNNMISYYDEIRGAKIQTKPFVFDALSSLLLLIRFTIFHKGLFDIFLCYVTNDVSINHFEESGNCFIELKSL